MTTIEIKLMIVTILSISLAVSAIVFLTAFTAYLRPKWPRIWTALVYTVLVVIATYHILRYFR
jgi:uncharacterized membrane protein